MELKCQRCGWEWEYTGEKSYPSMVNCPDCYTKVRLLEQQEQ